MSLPDAKDRPAWEANLLKVWRRPTLWAAGGTLGAITGLVAVIAGETAGAVWPLLAAAGLSGMAAWMAEDHRRRSGVSDLALRALKSDPRGQGIADAAGRWVERNDALTSLLAPAEGADTVIDMLVAVARGEDAAIEVKRLEAAARIGGTDHCEIPVVNGAGARAWYRVTATAVGGRPGRVSWTIEDVSAARELGAARRAGERMMEDFVDHMPVGFFSADETGRFFYVNRTLADWLGTTPADASAGKVGLSDFIVPDHLDDDDPTRQAAGDDQHGMVTLRDRDGGTFRAYLRQSERQGKRGEFVYSRSIVLRDFTDLAALTGAAREWEQFNRALFTDAPVGIVQLDLDGDVTDCNRAFLKLLGLHREGVVGRPLTDRIGREDRADLAVQLSKVLMRTIPAAALDVRMPATRQREVVATVYASRIDDAEGETVGLSLHFIDTTERRHLEAQFTQAQKVQAVGQLAGGIAHDFNNLLTAMIGFCDLLLGRHGPGDPSFADIMQIKENANRAANLVRQLLAFSRRQTLQPKIIQVTDVLSDLSNLLNRLIGEKIELRLLHGRDLAAVKVDPGQLDQVIVNLAVNARDAMKDGGALTIRTENVLIDEPVQRGHELIRAGDYVLIEVIDSGAGIAKEDIGRIFEPFFSTKDVGAGTGLGLSTVQGIIHQTGGHISVESAPGEGTTFTLYLPAFDQPAPRPRGAEIDARPRGIDLTGDATVLLVEDEDAVRLFAARALTNKGYRVFEADDGESALQIAEGMDRAIDLVVSDVVMPGMDGHTLVKQLRDRQPGIKVILISGYTEDAIPEEIGKDATVNFLAKPFSLNDLATKVKEVLDGD